MVRGALALTLIACCVAAVPTRHERSEVRIGGTPLALIADQGSLWVLTCDRGCLGEARQAVGRVLRIDPHRALVTGSGRLRRPHAIAVGLQGVYANDFWRDRIRLIDARTLRVVRSLKLKLPFQFSLRDNAFVPFAVAVGRNGVWVATDRGALARADLRLRHVVARVRLPFDAYGGMAVGPHAVWLGESLTGVYRVDLRMNRVVARIRVPLVRGRFDAEEVIRCGRNVLVLGNRTVGGVLTNHFYLARVDVFHNRAEVVAPLPAEPYSLTCGGGSLWLGRSGSSTLERIDPRTGEVVGRRTVRVGTSLAFADGRLWSTYPDGTIRQLGR
jgi:hypothetical protein